jgi:hypothetical protein
VGKYEVNNSYLVAHQKEYLSKLYFQTFTSLCEIINGKEYFPYYYKSKIIPLLFSGKKFNATLFMDGREYENIRLQYDTYTDELIYTDTLRYINSLFPKISLKKESVYGFIFVVNNDSMIFKYLRFSNDIKNKPEDGFYEVVYNGYSKYFIKHRSTLYIDDALKEYDYSPENFILTDGTCYKVRNNKELIQLFGQHSQELKEFLHQTKIHIRKANKHEITEIIKYCDSLGKKQ